MLIFIGNSRAGSPLLADARSSIDFCSVNATPRGSVFCMFPAFEFGERLGSAERKGVWQAKAHPSGSARQISFPLDRSENVLSFIHYVGTITFVLACSWYRKFASSFRSGFGAVLVSAVKLKKIEWSWSLASIVSSDKFPKFMNIKLELDRMPNELVRS